MDKKFKTYRQQLNLLRSRGLYIPTNGLAMRDLENENYYKIINGYKELFIDNSAINIERYIPNSKFSEIKALYLFDRELKFILLKIILPLETKLKSAIAYEFSRKNGHDNYLKKTCFDDLKSVSIKPKTLYERNEQISKLISKMQYEISENCSKKEYVKHYLHEYGYVPLWVLVNAISLGEVSKFFSLMKPAEQDAVSKRFNLKREKLKQYIKNLGMVRNICAHDDRLYNLMFYPGYEIEDTQYLANLNIEKINGSYEKGKKDLFALMIILKDMLDDKEFRKIKKEINSLLEKLNFKLSSIGIDNVLDKMGFPNNWNSL